MSKSLRQSGRPRKKVAVGAGAPPAGPDTAACTPPESVLLAAQSSDAAEAAARDEYIFWQGTERKAPKPGDRLWQRVVAAARDVGAPVRVYVMSQFLLDDRRFETPNWISGTRGRERYAEWCKVAGDLARDRILGDQHAFAAAIAESKVYNPGRDELELTCKVIQNPRAGLSPLFRACMAASFDLPHVYQACLPMAKRQYLTAPGRYDEWLGDSIPPAIRAAAKGIEHESW